MNNKSLLFGSRQPIQSKNKSVLGNSNDVNQLVPFKYDWSWERYLNSSANHWMPTEISMAKDVAQWKNPNHANPLTPQERKIFEFQMGFFATADMIVMNHLTDVIMPSITAPEIKQFLSRQVAEEAIHTHSYQHIVESLGMDESRVFNFYRDVPEVGNKSVDLLTNMYIKRAKASGQGINELEQELNSLTLLAGRDDLFESTKGTIKLLDHTKITLSNLIAQYVVMEGISFYCGFAIVLHMGTKMKLKNSAEQIEYIMRDESMHLNAGIDIINQIIVENPDIWDMDMQSHARRIVLQGYRLERDYAKMSLADSKDITFTKMDMYLQYITNRRLEQIGLAQEFIGVDNPFEWMGQAVDIKKEKNFFETRVTEYQVGGSLEWDDE